MEPWITVYRSSASTLEELVASLDEADFARPVPACPDWTVRELLAHLAGNATDVATGALEDAGTASKTAGQVAARASATVDELLDELRSRQADLEPTLQPGGPNAAWDISVHLADLYEALGRGIPPESTWLPVIEKLRKRIPEALAGLSDYEQFRLVFSRRSRAQIAALPGANGESFDDAGIFGPRDDDQPVPAAAG